MVFSFASEWLREWREFSEPITKQKRSKPDFFQHSIANCSKVLDNVLSIKCSFFQNYTESLAIQDTGWKNCTWVTVFCKNFRHLLKRLQYRAHSVIILSFHSHNCCSCDMAENGVFSPKRCTKEFHLCRGLLTVSISLKGEMIDKLTLTYNWDNLGSCCIGLDGELLLNPCLK